MVETELKGARPGKEFGDRVLRSIRRVRVFCSRTRGNAVLLTDSERRSFVIFTTYRQTEAIEPWLNGQGSMDDRDPHTALIRLLKRFGCAVEELAVTELKSQIFHGLLRLRTGNATVEVDCRPSDGLNLAVRANAPILADKKVVESALFRDAKGKPLSPAAAVQRFQETLNQTRSYRDTAAALRALERDPTAQNPRNALAEIGGYRDPRTRLLEDPSNGRTQLEDWVRKKKGTRLEAAGFAMLGATFLWSLCPAPEKAIPHFEAAYRLVAKKGDVPFGLALDLATAYALAGKREEALTLIERFDLLSRYRGFARLANFRPLWRYRRYRAIAGNVDPKMECCFVSGQFGCTKPEPKARPKPQKSVSKSRKKATKLLPVMTRKTGAARRRRFEEWLGCGSLTSVESLWTPPYRADAVVLGVEGKRAVGIPQKKADRAAPLGLQPPHLSRPLTAKLTCNTLRRVGLRLEAVAFLRRSRSGIEAALIVSEGERREAVPVTARGAVEIGFTAKCPVLMTVKLAEKLCLRDEAGRPLAPKAVLKPTSS